MHISWGIHTDKMEDALGIIALGLQSVSETPEDREHGWIQGGDLGMEMRPT